MDTVELKTWQDFRDHIDRDKQAMPVYWRGQENPNLPLASSFERKILALNDGYKPGASMLYPYDHRYQRGGKPTWEKTFYQNFRDRYLEAFRTAALGLRGNNPRELTRDEWWALGRHYGLVTPLLDWTEKPYMAAFFALSELWMEMNRAGGPVSFEGKRVAVFRLLHHEKLEGDGLRVVRPIVEELGRMHGQRGLFTWLDSEEFFELQGFLDNTGRGRLLTRLIISDQAVVDGLRDLAAHGIDFRTLFPDLPGAALHANTQVDWNLS